MNNTKLTVNRKGDSMKIWRHLDNGQIIKGESAKTDWRVGEFVPLAGMVFRVAGGIAHVDGNIHGGPRGAVSRYRDADWISPANRHA